MLTDVTKFCARSWHKCSARNENCEAPINEDDFSKKEVDPFYPNPESLTAKHAFK